MRTLLQDSLFVEYTLNLLLRARSDKGQPRTLSRRTKEVLSFTIEFQESIECILLRSLRQ